MTPAPHTIADRLSALQTPAGNDAMLALDQRESMRAVFPKTDTGEWADDTALREFKAKALAVKSLSQHASAVLLDRPYSVPTVVEGLQTTSTERLQRLNTMLTRSDDETRSLRLPGC